MVPVTGTNHFEIYVHAAHAPVFEHFKNVVDEPPSGGGV